MKPNLYNRIVRTVLFIAVILLIMKIPKQSLFLVLRIAIPGLILLSVWITWRRFIRKLHSKPVKKIAKK